jgi:hypothetical protein
VESNTPSRFELWRLVKTGIGDFEHTSYTHMVWSVDDDQPYWFRSADAAMDYIEARREGDTETAQRLAETHA